jgi:meiosis-specific transcription factor NDT80
MPPPSRSPGNPSSVSPSLSATARDNYTTATPYMNRHTFPPRNGPDLMCRSIRPPMAATPKHSDPSAGIFTPSPNTVFSNTGNAMQLDAATRFSFDAGNIPPFEKTKCLYPITTADRQPVHPDIQARIDKGFFKADQDWTCYRRNYFSIACSYTLKPPYLDSQPLYLHRPSSNPETIQAFAISISAVVDGEGGKPVELVQYTPKRDTGAKNSPDKIKLLPHSTGSLGVLSGPASGPSALGMPLPGTGSHLSGTEYDHSHSTPSASSSQDQTVANFDRIQFKHATANNGKRRAAQQYYNLVAELYAGILDGNVGSNDVRWVKVATRISAPMVVRGRSPGHYSDERRGSSASSGPGGPSGGGDSSESGGSSMNLGSAGSSSGARTGLPSLTYNSNTLRGGGGYQSHHMSYSNSPSGSASFPSSSSSSSSYGGPSTTDHPADQALTTEEGCPVEDYSRYKCYTSPMYDGSSIANHGVRTHLPSLSLPTSAPHRYDHQHPAPRLDAPFGYMTKTHDPRSSVKDEHHQSHNGAYPPPLTNPWYNDPAGTGSRCGKFQQLNSSRTMYYEMPTL